MHIDGKAKGRPSISSWPRSAIPAPFLQSNEPYHGFLPRNATGFFSLLPAFLNYAAKGGKKKERKKKLLEY